MTDESARWQVLSRACAAVGLPAEGAEPIRLGENAVFRLPGHLVARVSRPGHQETARREVAVSHWLNAAGVAAVAALAGIDQPVEVDGRSVTFWHELTGLREGTPVQVATVLKHLHALPVPAGVPLGPLRPFVRLAERLEGAVTLPDGDRAWLKERLADLEDQWAAVAGCLQVCVVHGDAWSGNVMASDGGQVVLLDLERCSIGPREWDLVSTAFKHVTSALITRTQYAEFCQTYGCDVTTWTGFETFRDIRELRVTCYAAQLAAEHPQYQQEARLRVDCLRGRHGPRPWPWRPVG
ncbi:MAG TPA: aminoglycoside phosphotransferase family protein [Streptosporangiaceae bacterium]|nr:aminoglycoside phosphotransferase family protein [Streptosporangiaceae bacterium]